MIELWYAILSVMLVVYIVLEGMDFGVGMLQYIVGKNDAERRVVIAAIGPLWSWHEVWLLGFGGTLMMAFPTILAVSFAGFYLALILLLWALLLRGISIEVGGHVNDPLWRTAWNFIFVGSNILLAVLVGAALGNVVRGVPIGADGNFTLSFFTDFSPTGPIGILDSFTILTAIFIVVTFAAHGANALVLRTEGAVHARSLRAAKILWKAVIVLLIVITVETAQVRPDLFAGMHYKPVAWLGLVCVLGGLIAVFAGLYRKREMCAVVGSSLFIAGLMIAGAASVFPFMLHSTIDPKYSLSAYHTAAPGIGLAAALVWWPISLILSVGYFWFILRHYTGKVKLTQDDHGPY